MLDLCFAFLDDGCLAGHWRAVAAALPSAGDASTSLDTTERQLVAALRSAADAVLVPGGFGATGLDWLPVLGLAWG